MEVKPGDINIWYARIYTGGTDFTGYLILAIIFAVISILFKYRYNEETFWKVYLFSFNNVEMDD